MNNFNYPFPTMQNSQSLTRVNGLEGAKAFQMFPGSTIALFDNAEDVFYIKQTDAAGFPTIRTFAFTETTKTEPTNENFVTREELKEYVEQLISQSNNKPNATSKPRTN